MSWPPGAKAKPSTALPFHHRAKAPSRPGSSVEYDRAVGVAPPISIGARDDEYEREADAVADEIVSGATLYEPLQTTGAKIQRACTACSNDEELQMKADPSGAAGAGGRTSHSVSAQIHRARRAGGRPLPQSTRDFMEQGFNRDLRQVRVHTGPDANELNHSLSARAFTVGNDVFFGRNQFQPTHRAGRHLVAHEITHTLQQAQASSASPISRAPLTLRRAALDGEQASAPSSEAQAGTNEACEASKPDSLAWQMDSTLTAVRTAEPGTGRGLLRLGSSGPAIERIQQALMAWGCSRGESLMPRYGADGHFGDETRSAVKAFQRVHGGGVDGIIGPLTLSHLDMFVVGMPLTGGGGIVVDDTFDGEMGDERRMKKVEFLDKLKAEACALAKTMLANTEYSFEDCHALFVFIDFLGSMEAGDIEQAIIAGAPGGARALSARQLINVVLREVRSSISSFLGGQDITSILTELNAPAFVIEAAKEEMGLNEDGQTQKKEVAHGGGTMLAPATVRHQLAGQGRPLEGGVRSRMESVMASNFSGVRVHTGPEAAGLASSMHARAFTVGNDIGFAPGEYQPGSLIGDALLAHELAHVQQQSGATQEEASSDTGSSQLEDAADDSALAAMLRLGGRVLDGFKNLVSVTAPRLKSRLRLSRCNCNSTTEFEGSPVPVNMDVFPTPGYSFAALKPHIEAAQEIWMKVAKIELVTTEKPMIAEQEAFDILSRDEADNDAELPGTTEAYHNLKCYLEAAKVIDSDGDIGSVKCLSKDLKENLEEQNTKQDKLKLLEQKKLPEWRRLAVKAPNEKQMYYQEGEGLRAYRRKHQSKDAQIVAFLVRVADGGHADPKLGQLYVSRGSGCKDIPGYTLAHEIAHMYFGDIHGEGGILEVGAKCKEPVTLKKKYAEDARLNGPKYLPDGPFN